jgi:hypothetical protein
MKCEWCGKFEVEYGSPANLCEPCWYWWWMDAGLWHGGAWPASENRARRRAAIQAAGAPLEVT